MTKLKTMFILETSGGRFLIEADQLKISEKKLEDVDGVMDVPACVFWGEIHEAFPDAKVNKNFGFLR